MRKQHDWNECFDFDEEIEQGLRLESKVSVGVAIAIVARVVEVIKIAVDGSTFVDQEIVFESIAMSESEQDSDQPYHDNDDDIPF